MEHIVVCRRTAQKICSERNGSDRIKLNWDFLHAFKCGFKCSKRIKIVCTECNRVVPFLVNSFGRWEKMLRDRVRPSSAPELFRLARTNGLAYRRAWIYQFLLTDFPRDRETFATTTLSMRQNACISARKNNLNKVLINTFKFDIHNNWT